MDPEVDVGQAASAPDAPTEETEVTATYTLVRIDTAHYAVPVEQVRRVLRTPRLTRVPCAADHVVGVFQHEGQVLLAWDLGVLAQAGEAAPERPPVLLCESSAGPFALVVPTVLDVVTLQGVYEDPVEAEHLHPMLAEAVTGRLRAAPQPEDPDANKRSKGHGLPFLLSRTTQPATGAALLDRVGVVHRLDLERLVASMADHVGTRIGSAEDAA